jgi:hypothetical protein
MGIKIPTRATIPCIHLQVGDPKTSNKTNKTFQVKHPTSNNLTNPISLHRHKEAFKIFKIGEEAEGLGREVGEIEVDMGHKMVVLMTLVHQMVHLAEVGLGLKDNQNLSRLTLNLTATKTLVIEVTHSLGEGEVVEAHQEGEAEAGVAFMGTNLTNSQICSPTRHHRNKHRKKEGGITICQRLTTDDLINY